MINLEYSLPVDSTFLSNILYEGVLRYLSIGSMDKAFKIMLQRIPDNERIYIISKNDRKIPRYIINALYGEEFLEQNVEDVRNLLDKNFIELIANSETVKNFVFSSDLFKIKIQGNSFVIGNGKITGFQLLKVDRYTGISSLETNFTTKQYTLRLSIESYLLALLGIYSSFVTYANGYYFFLFLSPDRVIDFYFNRPLQKIINFFRIKDKIIDEVREILKKTIVMELMIIELIANTTIMKLMKEVNLDSASLFLFRIAPEGQTYKIYESTPITIYSKPVFHDLCKKYFRSEERFIERIHSMLRPDEVILTRLAKANSIEYNNLIKAIYGLYRFIVLSNVNGLHEFIREILNAYEKTKNEYPRIAREYQRILKTFSYIF